MGDAGFYQQDKKVITRTQDRLAEVEAELAGCYQRWEALEE
jgi:ATP-binding cassette subfamily F protein uup